MKSLLNPDKRLDTSMFIHVCSPEWTTQASYEQPLFQCIIDLWVLHLNLLSANSVHMWLHVEHMYTVFPRNLAALQNLPTHPNKHPLKISLHEHLHVQIHDIVGLLLKLRMLSQQIWTPLFWFPPVHIFRNIWTPQPLYFRNIWIPVEKCGPPMQALLLKHLSVRM